MELSLDSLDNPRAALSLVDMRFKDDDYDYDSWDENTREVEDWWEDYYFDTDSISPIPIRDASQVRELPHTHETAGLQEAGHNGGIFIEA